VENILGQASKFIYCSRITVLTEELSRVGKEITTLVVSCFSGIVSSMMNSADVKTGLEQTMTSVGMMFLELVRSRPKMRVIAVHCTPRDLTDYNTHSAFAMVIRKWKLYLI
jgi:hypothetical protein